MDAPRRRALLTALLPALAAVAAYFSTLGAELVWDDALIAHRQLPYYASWLDVFRSSHGAPFAAAHYYRPLVLLSFLVDRAWGGADLAFAFHASNLAFHAAATVLVHALARRLLAGRGEGEWGALAAALLFALHPVHVESVALAAGRTDLLATAFFLAALWAALSPRRRGAAPLAALFFLAALLCKETAVSLLVALPVFWWAAKGPEGEGRRRAAWLAGALAAYAALRLAAATGQAPSWSLGEAVKSLPGALGYYLLKTVFPWPLDPLGEPLSPALGAGLAALALGAGFAAWRRLPSGDRPLLAALAAWYAASLAPALAVLALREVPAVVAERYLYLPSAAACLLAGLAAARVPRRARPWAGALLIVALAAGAAGTLAGARAWRANIPFWENAVTKGDNARDSTALFNLAESYRLAGRYGEALATLERIDGQRSPALAAQAALKKAAVLAALAWEELGAGRHGEAARRAEGAMALLEPHRAALSADAFFHATQGVGWLIRAQASEAGTGRPDTLALNAALGYLRKAAELDPAYPPHREMLAQAERERERARGR